MQIKRVNSSDLRLPLSTRCTGSRSWRTRGRFVTEQRPLGVVPVRMSGDMWNLMNAALEREVKRAIDSYREDRFAKFETLRDTATTQVPWGDDGRPPTADAEVTIWFLRGDWDYLVETWSTVAARYRERGKSASADHLGQLVRIIEPQLLADTITEDET